MMKCPLAWTGRIGEEAAAWKKVSLGGVGVAEAGTEVEIELETAVYGEIDLIPYCLVYLRWSLV